MIAQALQLTFNKLTSAYSYTFRKQSAWSFADIYNHLDIEHPVYNEDSYLTPQGGIICIDDGNLTPILIADGHNHLGRHMLAFRYAISGIFPFVAFGDGNAYFKGSKMLDNLSSMIGYSCLNEINVVNGSLFFRQPKWKVDEMASIMLNICRTAIIHFRAKDELI